MLRATADQAIALAASIELVQEFAHVLLRRSTDRAEALAEIDEVRAQCRLHALDAQVLDVVLDVMRDAQVGVRDAVHAATALVAGHVRVLSADRVFDRIEQVARVDPAAAGSAWAPYLV